LTNDAIKKALYVSLFGIKDIQQLKLRIMESAIPDSKTDHAAREVITSATRLLRDGINQLQPDFNAAPSFLRHFAPLALEVRTHVDPACAAFHLGRRPQTLRVWACAENGPLVRFGLTVAWLGRSRKYAACFNRSVSSNGLLHIAFRKKYGPAPSLYAF